MKQFENILLVDTSLRRCLVAVAKGDQLSIMQVDDVQRGQDALLPKLVSQALEDVGIQIKDLSLLVGGIGPGSFTGIRVGMAYLIGLKMAGSAPLIGLNSFEILSPSIISKGDHVVAVPIKSTVCAVQKFDDKGASDQEPFECKTSDLETLNCPIFIPEGARPTFSSGQFDSEDSISFVCDDLQKLVNRIRNRKITEAEVFEPFYLRGADVTINSKKQVIS